MTDKELLEQNNAQIKAIKEILNGKMLGSGVKIKWTLLDDGSYKLDISSK